MRPPGFRDSLSSLISRLFFFCFPSMASFFSLYLLLWYSLSLAFASSEDFFPPEHNLSIFEEIAFSRCKVVSVVAISFKSSNWVFILSRNEATSAFLFAATTSLMKTIVDYDL